MARATAVGYLTSCFSVGMLVSVADGHSGMQHVHAGVAAGGYRGGPPA
jgi:hypothetical protein